MCYTCACNKYYNSTLQRQAHAYGMHEINNNMVQSLFRYYIEYCYSEKKIQ